MGNPADLRQIDRMDLKHDLKQYRLHEVSS